VFIVADRTPNCVPGTPRISMWIDRNRLMLDIPRRKSVCLGGVCVWPAPTAAYSAVGNTLIAIRSNNDCSFAIWEFFAHAQKAIGLKADFAILIFDATTFKAVCL